MLDHVWARLVMAIHSRAWSAVLPALTPSWKDCGACSYLPPLTWIGGGGSRLNTPFVKLRALCCNPCCRRHGCSTIRHPINVAAAADGTTGPKVPVALHEHLLEAAGLHSKDQDGPQRYCWPRPPCRRRLPLKTQNAV